ncbi:MAG: 3-keto-5-aminohexanoate cleavage protein [Acidimicrobiales bacterium]
MTATADLAPAIVEAAISPLRWNVPAQSVGEIVAEANECIDAGAGIVHHHHDMRLGEPAAVDQLVEISRRILETHPGSLVYTDYLTGRRAWDENAHLRAMAEAGVLTMFAIDPGITTFPSLDDSGLPTRTYTDGLQFSEAHEMATFSKEAGVPISLGVFEPGHLRWIVSYARTAGFSPGTMIKLYFGGSHMVDHPNTPGINFGLPPTPAALDVYLSMMGGCGLPWTVSLFGDPVLDSPLARHALEMGGHLRVGVEDAASMTDMSNVEMVEAAIDLASEVGRPVATGAAVLGALTGATAPR